jgi:hypothetical protein
LFASKKRAYRCCSSLPELTGKPHLLAIGQIKIKPFCIAVSNMFLFNVLGDLDKVVLKREVNIQQEINFITFSSMINYSQCYSSTMIIRETLLSHE